MGLPFTAETPATAYESMQQHIGHKLACVYYVKPGYNPVSVVIECVTCGVVLLDVDRPDEQEEAETEQPSTTKEVPGSP